MPHSIHDLPALSAPEENSLYARVTWRLLPILVLCYIIAYLDRVNVGFAKLQMLHDLHFSEATYGLGAGIFFVGYCTFEVPGNLLLSRYGARRWLARIMVAWGIISACTLFVRTPVSFYVLRCLLGIAEASLFPGIIFYLTGWYPARRRGHILALFMAAQPVSGLIGSPLSGWIMQFLQGTGRLAGWQWLFLIEAFPAIVMGVVFHYCISDRIRDAHWLSEEQKQWLESRIDTESAHKQKHGSFLSILGSGRVWLLSLISFCSVMGLYGISFWLPSILRATGVQKPLAIGLLMTIPYGAAMVAMILFARSSDRTGERRWHLAVSTLMGGFGLIFSTLFAGHTALALAGLTLATAGVFTSQPLFWNLPTAFLGGTAAAAGIAFINTMGNTAGFISPYLVGWIVDLTHHTTVGMYLLAFFLLLGSALTFCVPASLVNTRPEATHTTEETRTTAT
ncbi:MFS transporter [Paracidobacterium acidisoli]|uniref:MFS transporter n=1 Tax=Paracidobacterium acidisoli TaxID=2303751 RepID=A0A372ISD6_9BACT|nr:MFS transporter [Paracidobacterium acidisoli]MBT9330774.1 MFS transporter [Paracidobacterium acidisoli]